MVTQKPRLAFTYIDYVNAPEDRRYELLDGDLVMVPAPKRSHQNALLDLAVDLELLMRRTGMGQVFAAPFDVVLTNTDVVQPDIIFVSTERAHIITEDNVQGAPDLVVEILSPSTANRDRTFKRSLYARHGVKEYWIVRYQTQDHRASSSRWRRLQARRCLRSWGYSGVSDLGRLRP